MGFRAYRVTIMRQYTRIRILTPIHPQLDATKLGVGGIEGSGPYGTFGNPRTTSATGGCNQTSSP